MLALLLACADGKPPVDDTAAGAATIDGVPSGEVCGGEFAWVP